MGVSNAPSKHHYIPECYLKAWAGDNGRLCEFKRGHGGRVRRRWTSPGGTGYAIDLYAIPELGPLSTDIEQQFLRPVDGEAARILRALRTESRENFTAGERSVWATFLLSILLRNPESIGAIKSAILERWNAPRPELQEIYERQYRKEGDPESVDEYLAREESDGAYRLIYKMIPDTMTHERVGTFIINMRWGIVDIPTHLPELLTSDRPIIMSNGLDQDDGHLAIPVSPRRLFLACKNEQITRQILGMTPRDLVRRTNQLVVERAKRLVFSTDERQLRFIQNRLSNEPIPTLGESIAKNADW